MSLKVSLARRADVTTIADASRRYVEHGLAPAWTDARVARCVAHRDWAVIVARDHRRFAGCAIMEFLDAHAHLALLVVLPGFRRRGVGRRLVHWLEESARTAGIFSVRLELRAANDTAREFYTNLGFRTTGLKHAYYDNREDALTMAHDMRVVATGRP